MNICVSERGEKGVKFSLVSDTAWLIDSIKYDD